MTYLFRAFAESLNITQLTNAKLSQSLWISWPAAIVISGASLFSPCIHAGRKSAARLSNLFFSRKDEGWSDGCLWWSSSILPSGTVDYMLVLVWKWLFAIYLHIECWNSVPEQVRLARSWVLYLFPLFQPSHRRLKGKRAKMAKVEWWRRFGWKNDRVRRGPCIEYV